MSKIIRPIAVALVLGLFLVAYADAQSGRAALRRAQQQIDTGDLDAAQESLERVVVDADGDILHEALFTLAGVVTDVDRAKRYYQRIIDDDPRGEWGSQAYVEMAKMEYALGNYDRAYAMLNDADACSVSEEACLFLGLSALALENYDAARTALSNIRRGKMRTWAYLSLGEAEMGLNRVDEACDRYEALANALISPTAIYRYAECLEDRGDVSGASKEYGQIISQFRETPEAVLAAEKLQRFSEPVTPAASEPPAVESKEAGQAVLDRGFTLQFGSFRDRGNAIKLAAKIKRVYPAVRIDSDLVQYREYHRVRYGYFATRAEATAKGEQISREMNEDYSVMTLP